ncbi:MAG: choice-of-anchor tandem repeat GloVer-containing protein [Candidatus Korobacteraceae bacterium]
MRSNQGPQTGEGIRCRLAASFLTAAFLLLLASTAQAQTYTVLHNLTGGIGGDTPLAGVTLDQQGRIYGTTEFGGSHQNGMVYRLAREGEGWVFSPIYSFGSQQDDGNDPIARVLFGPNGLLYGTTSLGGIQNKGTVFSLQPPPTACKSALCPWVETVLYSFTGGADGGDPFFGDLTFDQLGNIYGTTANSGNSGDGVVFKLTRSGGGWTESVLWNFTGSDGGFPLSGVIFDSAGNLYGTTSSGGGNGLGTVYELSPTQSGWSETTLYSFTSDTGPGAGGLVMDAQGDLLGMTGGVDDSTNVAFELTPQNGSWSFSVLQTFAEQEATPFVGPTLDSQGNLYGPLPTGGDDHVGEIFKLTHSGDQWTYSPFYQFVSCMDGCFPGAVTFDASGNMYGTTSDGGTDGYGTVWEITP